MKKYLIHSRFYTFVSLALLIFFVAPAIVSAGCCTVLTPSRTNYENLTREQCAEKNIAYAGSSYEFDEKKVAGPKGCVDNETTAVSAVAPEKPIIPVLQVKIPGLNPFTEVKCDDKNPECATPWLAQYLQGLYNYGLIVIGILAAIVMMIGGVIRLSAGGNRGLIGTGMELIKGSLLGVILAFSSYAILFLLSPNLTVLKPITVSHITETDLDDYTEAVPESVLAANPNRGMIETDTSKWIPVPNDNKGLGIWTPKNEISSPGSIEALKKGADCFRKLSPNFSVRVSDASRSQQEQKSLYSQNCDNGRRKCSPPTCNPNGGICPHTSGAAFDAWACDKGDCKDETNQKALQKCMISAGFCLLSSECWHFEYPQVSPACGNTLHYTGKYCT